MAKVRPTPVLRAAYNWWKSRRPVGTRQPWSEREHLKHPTINCTTDAEKRLARAVAKAMKVRVRRDARTGRAPLWCMEEQRFVFPGKYGCCDNCGSTSVMSRAHREEEIKAQNG